MYGDPNPAFTVTPTGLVNGNTVADLTGTLTFTTGADATSPVGTYAIGASGLALGQLRDHLRRRHPDGRPGRPDDHRRRQTKVYGDPNPAFTVTPTGLVNGNTVADLAGTLVFTAGADATSPAGTYPVSASGRARPTTRSPTSTAR